ncbi:MAG TPA: glycosyltransferase family 1 protein [Bacillota bacterium]|nr:glycosyltransferase family 1 protein [Bacillota bacterium]
MKIAIEARPIKWSYGTGIGNYTYCFIEKLNELDPVNEYTFLWPDDQPQPFIPMTRSYSHYSLPKDDRREELEIPQWLENERADLFHLPQNGFRTPKTRTSKIIVTIHDLIPYMMPEVVRTSFLKRFVMEMPEIIDRSHHIITVSQTSKDDIIRLFNVASSKISVIPSAPATGFVPLPQATVRKTLINKYRLKKPYILYVGGLNPRKNLTELICAYAKIYRELPQGELLVIPGGESRHLQNLRILAGVLGLDDAVVFPGFVDSADLPLLYNGASLFIYPSLYEGFGLPPIEAMACGTPVITSDTSSLPEVVGDAALLVNPYDTLKLGETMLQVLTDPSLAQTLSQKGLEHSKKYNWESNAAQILKIYEQTLNSNGC